MTEIRKVQAPRRNVLLNYWTYVSSVGLIASGNENGRSNLCGGMVKRKMTSVSKNLSASRHSSRTSPTSLRLASNRAHHALSQKRLRVQPHQRKFCKCFMKLFAVIPLPM